MSRISLSNEEDDFPSASTEETRDGERTRLLPKSGSQTRMQGIQNEMYIDELHCKTSLCYWVLLFDHLRLSRDDGILQSSACTSI